MTSPQEPRITLSETDVIKKPIKKRVTPLSRAPEGVTFAESHQAYLDSHHKVLQYQKARDDLLPIVQAVNVLLEALIVRSRMQFPVSPRGERFTGMLQEIENMMLVVGLSPVFAVAEDVPF